MALQVPAQLQAARLALGDIQMVGRTISTVKARLLGGIPEQRDAKGNVTQPGISADEYKAALGEENIRDFLACEQILMPTPPAAPDAK